MITYRARIWTIALAASPACDCETATRTVDGGTITDTSPVTEGGIVSDTPGTTDDGASLDAADTGKGGGVACYVADQFRCEEFPTPTETQVTDVLAKCSSVSGVPSQPAACPPAGFRGKCTRPASEGMVERFYTGADVAYAQDFCVNTAHGAWSTVF